MDRRHIETLVMDVQNAFLVAPSLTLTLPQAQRQFRLDGQVCRAILEALTESGVLARTQDGVYVRAFPRAGTVTHHAA